MESTMLKVHGPWAIGLICAFFAGSYANRSSQENSNLTNRQQAAASERSSLNNGTSSGMGQDRDGSSSRRGGTAGTSESGVAEIFDTATLAGGIDSLAIEALKDPNQIKRRLAFSKLLEGLTPENAAQMRDQLVELGVRDSEWRDFNYAWGALAGREGFEAAMVSEKKDLESMMTGWAAVDPEGAMAMLDQLPAELAERRGRLEASIVGGLADRDPDEAVAYVSSLADSGREDTRRLMETVTQEVLRKGGTEEASVWVADLADGPLKGAAMNEVAERYVRNDPEAASVWIEQYAGEDYAARAVAEVGGEWAERDPLAAVGWLEKLPEGDGQKRGLNSAFGDWEDKDPVAAGEYLLSMPNSAKRDSAIAGFAEGYAYQDPETAIAWAQDISDPSLRTEALTRTARAFYRRDPEGAKTWLPSSGLSAEAQAAVTAPRDRGRGRRR